MKHILFTLKGCSEEFLDDEEFVRDVLYNASKKCQSTCLLYTSDAADE